MTSSCFSILRNSPSEFWRPGLGTQAPLTRPPPSHKPHRGPAHAAAACALPNRGQGSVAWAGAARACCCISDGVPVTPCCCRMRRMDRPGAANSAPAMRAAAAVTAPAYSLRSSLTSCANCAPSCGPVPPPGSTSVPAPAASRAPARAARRLVQARGRRGLAARPWPMHAHCFNARAPVAQPSERAVCSRMQRKRSGSFEGHRADTRYCLIPHVGQSTWPQEQRARQLKRARGPVLATDRAIAPAAGEGSDAPPGGAGPPAQRFSVCSVCGTTASSRRSELSSTASCGSTVSRPAPAATTAGAHRQRLGDLRQCRGLPGRALPSAGAAPGCQQPARAHHECRHMRWRTQIVGSM